MLKKTLLLIVINTLLLLGQGYARQGGGVFVAEAAAPMGDDAGLARDIALLRAKQAALEMAGMGLARETIVDMGLLLDDIVKVQTFGLIQSCDILAEKNEGRQYRVKIRARVVPKALGKKVLKNFFAHRSMRIERSGQGSATIEKTLSAQLTQERYFVLAQGFNPWPPDYALTITSSVIRDRAVHGIEAFRAACDLGMIQRSTNRLLISVQAPQDNRIYGLDQHQALHDNGPNGFAARIAGPVVAAFMRRLNDLALDQYHDVEVVVSGLPDHRSFQQQFCKMLQALRLGVKDVTNRQYNGRTGRVIVSYGEKTDYLAALIGFRSQYTIAKATWDRIDVVYQAK